MISRKLSIVLAATLVVAASTITHAADDASDGQGSGEAIYGGKAPYVSFGGVYAAPNVKGVPGDVGDTGGYDIRGGYNVHDMAAIEIHWQSLLNFSRDAQDPITGNDEPSLEARMLSLNGRISPLNGRIQPYGLIGMGWVNVQADKVANHTHKSSFGMRFGLGVAAFLTERTGLALEAGYILPLTGNLGGAKRFDIIPITMSIFFRFK